MIRQAESKIYYKLPLIYSHIMRKINYETWAKYIYSLVHQNVNRNGLVLELAAGNCRLANYLKFYYPNLTATDISKNMLASENNNPVTRVCCDMIKLPFKIKFDLIYCTFDSVNYLTSRKKLFELFKQVYSSLMDGGIFTFDASLEKNSISHSRQSDRNGIYKGITFKQSSEYDREKRIHKNIFSIRLNKNEMYTEIHKQKIFPFETYFELIESAGLYVENCYHAFSVKEGKPDSSRIQLITKKAKNNVEL